MMMALSAKAGVSYPVARASARILPRPPRLARALVIASAEAPSSAREAIQVGIAMCQEKDFNGALSIFEQSLTLPGTGLKRFKDKPAEASAGERQAALYNIACCHSQLGDLDAALKAMAQCLQAGYEGFEELRSDPDLAALRSDPRFAELLARFEPRGGAGLGGLFSGLRRVLGDL